MPKTNRFPAIRDIPGDIIARVRGLSGRRAVAVVLALLVEVLLILMLFTLNVSEERKERPVARMSTFDIGEESQPDEAPEEFAAQDEQQSSAPVIETQPEPAQPTPDTPLPQVVLPERVAPASPTPQPVPRKQAPAAPNAQVYGPPDTGSRGPADSQRVGGSGPNGEPLYAASWYREPYDDELRGYLSTADGPGWGLIACRTVPDYRVEDCVIVGEYPPGSRIARSVLAASWQFRVRPPRIGGKLQVGEWVRIRIDYTQLRR